MSTEQLNGKQRTASEINAEKMNEVVAGTVESDEKIVKISLSIVSKHYIQWE